MTTTDLSPPTSDADRGCWSMTCSCGRGCDQLDRARAAAVRSAIDAAAGELLALVADPINRFMVGGPVEPELNAISQLVRVARELGYIDPEPPPRPLSRREEADRAAAKAFRRIGERDGFRCRVCGTDRTLTVDHIIAVVNGGSDDDDNFQLLCRSHNSAKGAR